MNAPPLPDPRLALAHRIHLGLMRELGQGIDLRQLLDDDRYARDVLLVCQAYPATELAALGAAFAQLARPTPTAAPAAGIGADRGRARPGRRGVRAGFDGVAAADVAPPSGLRRWLVPSNWVAR